MRMLRIIVVSGVLLVEAGLALALPGCGGGAPAPNADGTVPVPPGTVDLSQETGQAAPTKKAK